MQSGIGDETELKRFGIPVLQHLPGVGKNFQDHVLACCVWEYAKPLASRNNAAEATVFWKSHSSLDTPDIQVLQMEFPLSLPRMRITARRLPGGLSVLLWSVQRVMARSGSPVQTLGTLFKLTQTH
jgi:choline dehydrogenase